MARIITAAGVGEDDMRDLLRYGLFTGALGSYGLEVGVGHPGVVATQQLMMMKDRRPP